MIITDWRAYGSSEHVGRTLEINSLLYKLKLKNQFPDYGYSGYFRRMGDIIEGQVIYHYANDQFMTPTIPVPAGYNLLIQETQIVNDWLGRPKSLRFQAKLIGP